MAEKPVVFPSGEVFVAFQMIIIGSTMVASSKFADVFGSDRVMLAGACIAVAALLVQPIVGITAILRRKLQKVRS